MFMETDMNNRKNMPWNRLTMTEKMSKIEPFLLTYAVEHSLEPEEVISLRECLVNAIKNKKMLKSSDVVYDSTMGVLKGVNGLMKSTNGLNKYTLRVSTANVTVKNVKQI